MNTLRRICAATILSLTLAVSALAGHIDCPGVASTGSGSATTNVILTIVSVIYSEGAFQSVALENGLRWRAGERVLQDPCSRSENSIVS